MQSTPAPLRWNGSYGERRPTTPGESRKVHATTVSRRASSSRSMELKSFARAVIPVGHSTITGLPDRDRPELEKRIAVAAQCHRHYGGGVDGSGIGNLIKPTLAYAFSMFLCTVAIGDDIECTGFRWSHLAMP